METWWLVERRPVFWTRRSEKRGVQSRDGAPAEGPLVTGDVALTPSGSSPQPHARPRQTLAKPQSLDKSKIGSLNALWLAGYRQLY